MVKKSLPDFNFKIVAGSLKGKTIKAPDLGVTRPPLTRLRKSIFDFLNPYLPGCSYLDLFSGTGSYLFEAVSRGADTALGVELEPKLVEAINEQARKLGVEKALRCYCADVFKMIERFSSDGMIFDVVMIAPPQYKGIVDQTLRLMHEHPLIDENSIVLCQHDSSESRKIYFSLFDIAQQRKYGNTTYTIVHRK